MGIPRLTQDVQPYAKPAFLGRGCTADGMTGIRKIVVDGPSLVYHVYNRLLAHIRSTPQLGVLSYTEINTCLLQILSDFEQVGIEIVKIYFDGALPLSKRDVRLERLGKTRKQLENIRRLFTNSSMQVRDHNRLDSAQVLWQPSDASYGQQQLLQPPFMVASAIENLMASRWCDIVQIVPNEADASCAACAAQFGASVLTNDSDLMLYELGPQGAVIKLSTLELDDTAQSGVSIKAQIIHPEEIAKRLSVPNMLSFAFQRSLSPSDSTAVVAKHANSLTSSGRALTELTAFAEGYAHPYCAHSEITENQTDMSSVLSNVDPRNAELVCSLAKDEELYMYLPILFEDHDRDSSWAYGLHIRQIAYSLMVRYRSEHKTMKAVHITEHARRGARIVPTQVEPLSATLIQARLSQLVHLQKLYEASRHTNHHGADMIFKAYLLATHIVLEQRVSKMKDYNPALRNLFNLDPNDQMLWSWDDIHLLANIHAVLYSIRMLSQLSRCALTLTAQSGIADPNITSYDSLPSLPSIADLFLDLGALRKTWSQLPDGVVAQAVEQLLTRVDPKFCPAGTVIAKPASVMKSSIQSWAKVKQKKGKSSQGSKSVRNQAAISGESKKAVETVASRVGSLNAFALLDE